MQKLKEYNKTQKVTAAKRVSDQSSDTIILFSDFSEWTSFATFALANNIVTHSFLIIRCACRSLHPQHFQNGCCCVLKISVWPLQRAMVKGKMQTESFMSVHDCFANGPQI